MNIKYHAKRFVPASRTPGGPETELLCMVMIELPDGNVTSLAIPENEMTTEVGYDPAKEEIYIQRKVTEVVTSMLAGAVGDLRLARN
jgi:hypothetical protein